MKTDSNLMNSQKINYLGSNIEKKSKSYICKKINVCNQKQKIKSNNKKEKQNKIKKISNKSIKNFKFKTKKQPKLTQTKIQQVQTRSKNNYKILLNKMIFKLILQKVN